MDGINEVDMLNMKRAPDAQHSQLSIGEDVHLSDAVASPHAGIPEVFLIHIAEGEGRGGGCARGGRLNG